LGKRGCDNELLAAFDVPGSDAAAVIAHRDAFLAVLL
jgi:hypothetical protein